MQTVLAIACAVLIFGIAFGAMAIGLMLRGTVLRGGCGSHSGKDGKVIGCDACSKKQLNICDDEASSGLSGPSIAGTMGRFKAREI